MGQQRVTKRLVFLMVAVFLMCFATTVYMQEKGAVKAPDPAEVQAVTQWLKAHAIPLKSVEAGHGFDDLKPLKKVFANVRIVGLGEATHGTREFFQFKHRMVEFLVKEMGFNVFSIEASYVACLNINDYVLYGKGDRAKALASQGFWTWDTNEVSDMIDWMREYNKTAPEGKKVKFLGYDVQHYSQAFDVILGYLKKVAPDYISTAEAAFKPFRVDSTAFMRRTPEEMAQSRPALEQLMGFLVLNQTRFVRETSPAEFEKVLQHARILAQFDDSYGRATTPQATNNPLVHDRDYYMAENIEYLMNQEGPGTRMIVWAHNGHISTAKLGNAPAMGSFLRKIYGPAYYSLAFTFGEGSFQSRNMTGGGALEEFTLGPAPEGSVDWFFAQPGIPNYIVDFRSAPKEGVFAKWLGSPHPMRSMGSGFSKEWPPQQYMVPTVLPNEYDGLIYIGKTTRARPNPSGMRGPMEMPARR
jgi:erythromycin esterase